MTELLSPVLATEKMNYSSFLLHNVVTKLSHIPTRIIDWPGLRLPNDSVLHAIDRFLTPYGGQEIYPDLELPPIKNEQFLRFMKSVITPAPSASPRSLADSAEGMAEAGSSRFAITDRYQLRVSPLQSLIRNFYTTHKSVRQITAVDPHNAALAKNTLVILDYNPLRQALITGRLANYRHFDFLARSIFHMIDHLADTPRHHYLHIPLSEHIYARTQFRMPFEKLDSSSLRIHDDPSFFFLIHFLGYLADAQTSLLLKFDPGTLDRLNLIFQIGDFAIVYNLGDLKALKPNDQFWLSVLRHINLLKLTASRAAHDLPATLDDEEFDRVTEQMARKESPQASDESPVVVSSKPAVPPTSEPNAAPAAVAPPATPAPVPTTAPSPAETTPIELPPAPTAEVPVQPELPTPPAANPAVAPSPVAATGTADTTAAAGPVEVLRQKVHAQIDQRQDLTEAQKERARQLFERHLSTQLHGKSIKEHLESTPPSQVVDKMEFLHDQLPDPSMAGSSVTNYDQHYVKHMLHRDLAQVVSHFATQGLYISNIEVRHEHNQLSNIIHYKVTLQDAQGKQHTLTFRLPVIHEDGSMLVNGVRSRLTNQMVNLPICKVSPTRVNLSSAYNKALVERSQNRVNRFDVYLATIINGLRRMGRAEVSYGRLESAVKLPYDYSCAAGTYAGLSMKRDGLVLELSFDYPNRFGLLEHYALEGLSQGELYQERQLLAERQQLLEQQQILRQQIDVLGRRGETEALALALEAYDSAGAAAGAVKLIAKSQQLVSGREAQYGVFLGVIRDEKSGRATRQLYLDHTNRLHVLSGGPGAELVNHGTTSLLELILKFAGEDFKPKEMAAEWTELKLLDRSFPLAFVLGHQFGISRLITMLGLKHRLVEPGKRLQLSPTELAIRFADRTLVFDRYPLTSSLVMAGWLNYETKAFNYADFDHDDAYYQLLDSQGISINYLRGMKNFFELFLDPITTEVLVEMGEPTSVEGLLLRATEMLSDAHALEASSMANHRIRGYERLPALLYREVATQYARHVNQPGAHKKSFSLHPDAVFFAIVTDATAVQVEEINPTHNVKAKTAVTYSGAGGRTAQSFVVNDRRYPEDGVGKLSECTPDSGKVAITAYTTANPVIKNNRGMFADTPPAELSPTQLLSATTCLFAGATQDDGKRANFISIQLSHHVPSKHSSVNRIRTGYELVLPHMTNEVYACPAKADGVVEAIDDKLKLVRIRYADKSVATDGRVTLPVSDMELRNLRLHFRSLYIIKPGSQADFFKLGRLLDAGPAANVKVGEVLRFQDLDKVPDVHKMSRQAHFDLALKLKLGQEKEVLYIRLDPVDKTEPGEVDLYRFGVQYTPVSGSYVEQDIRLNVKAGEKIKRGDIIAYNAGFFEPDPDSKQVAWKHGVMAKIAFMELSSTLEDSCEISREFSHKMETTPGHQRRITITKDTILHSIRQLGEHVETTDLLCEIEDSALTAGSLSDDPGDLALLTSLSRKALKAKFHGEIAEIMVYYACEIKDLHPTIQALVRRVEQPLKARAAAAKDTVKAANHLLPQKVAVGTKYAGVDFEIDTVVIEFIIAHEMPAEQGDKLVIMSANKTVIGNVMAKTPLTESGLPIDILFSGSSVLNRIVLSPYINGIGNRALEGLEKKICEIYFDN